MNAVSCAYVLYLCSFLPYFSLQFPLCTNSRVPLELTTPLNFCQYNGSSCCDSTQDFLLRKQFEDLKVSDPVCATVMRSILCAKCDPCAAQLFDIDAGQRSIPILCNTTLLSKSTLSKDDPAVDFCSMVWDKCGNISISSSPFSLSKEKSGTPLKSTASKVIDKWHTQSDFCEAFGRSPDDRTVCFDGTSASFSSSKDPLSRKAKGICIEKIASGSYISMDAHPDGSDRVFLASQEGKIWLASISAEGSNRILQINQLEPFIDISDQVLFETKYGLFGMAFHPEFKKNGRYFVSYNCDKLKHTGCSGRCSCNLDAHCDPASIPAVDGVAPCQYQNVVAEYSTNHNPPKSSSVETASLSEVRRIFTMGLPSYKGHAGQIIFGPDGYLYYVVSHESKDNDQFNFVQNKKSLLGKILRLDVNKIPSKSEVDKKKLWGNYSIPEDNPYMDDKELLPEIWAMGLRNPWRCSFDAERPSYFICGEAGQDLYEEVDIITKGGNYGWPLYEGFLLSHGGESRKGNTEPNSINSIFPVMVYTRYEGDGSASSIVGGYFYRSTTDPCLYGRYLFADVYAQAIWVSNELPENSGNFSSIKMHYTCATDSPFKCDMLPGSDTPAMGYTYSFGEDNRKDIYILTSSGVYRIVNPSRCNFSCSEASKSDSVRGRPSTSSTTSASSSSRKLLLLEHLFVFVTFAGLYIS